MTARRLGTRLARLLAAVLTASVLAASFAPAASAATDANALNWQIDHRAKTITATIRITLTPACTLNQIAAGAFDAAMRSRCTVTQEIADRIKKDIESVWNDGNKYYCYDFIVKVEITIDNNPSSPDPTNRARVQVDQSAVNVRSFVNSVGRAGSPWNGSSPDDLVWTRNDGTASSTWGYPPQGRANANLYAHEAGHVMGLDDGYEDYVGSDGKTYSRPRPGAPDDLMTHQKHRNVDKSTMRRLVERNGMKKTDLKCNYEIDQPSFGGRIKGKKCDPLGGQWIADGTYSYAGANGSQQWIITIDENTKRGDFIYTDRQVAEFVLGIIVTTEGTAVGRATLTIDDELNAHFQLVEQVHTYTATTSGGGKGKDQNAPLQSINLEWKPIGRCTTP